MKEYQVQGFDGKQIHRYVWDEVAEPKAVMQIVHGMVEHAARYDEFARFLNEHGYLVVAHDLRAHGKTDPQTLGYSEGDIFEGNVRDQLCFEKELKETYRLPLVVMGHSYGSFVTQALILRNEVADAFVLSGSNLQKGITVSLGSKLNGRVLRKKGGAYPAELMAKMTFETWQKKQPKGESWLSNDRQQVKKYEEDEFCSFVCSTSFYDSFFRGLKTLYQPKSLGKIPKNLPIYLFAGDGDPVGNYSKGVHQLYRMYQQLGLSNVALKIYHGGKHEMLNCVERQQVYEDVLEQTDRMLKVE